VGRRVIKIKFELEMTKEEMISKIVQLEIDNSVVDFQLNALFLTLKAKGFVNENELMLMQKSMLDQNVELMKSKGMDSKYYEMYLKESLGIE
jgi:thymidine phosphorylase